LGNQTTSNQAHNKQNNLSTIFLLVSTSCINKNTRRQKQKTIGGKDTQTLNHAHNNNLHNTDVVGKQYIKCWGIQCTDEQVRHTHAMIEISEKVEIMKQKAMQQQWQYRTKACSRGKKQFIQHRSWRSNAIIHGPFWYATV